MERLVAEIALSVSSSYSSGFPVTGRAERRASNRNGFPLMRLAARQARRVRDDLARALSELSEIDGRHLAAIAKKRGYGVLVVRIGPPLFPLSFLLFRPACHRNTRAFPRASIT